MPFDTTPIVKILHGDARAGKDDPLPAAARHALDLLKLMHMFGQIDHGLFALTMQDRVDRRCISQQQLRMQRGEMPASRDVTHEASLPHRRCQADEFLRPCGEDHGHAHQRRLPLSHVLNNLRHLLDVIERDDLYIMTRLEE